MDNREKKTYITSFHLRNLDWERVGKRLWLIYLHSYYSTYVTTTTDTLGWEKKKKSMN